MAHPAGSGRLLATAALSIALAAACNGGAVSTPPAGTLAPAASVAAASAGPSLASSAPVTPFPATSAPARPQATQAAPEGSGRPDPYNY